MTIKGAAGHVLEFPTTLGALLDGTTVTSAILRARAPSGGPFLDWPAVIEDPEETSVLLTYALPAQLEAGDWTVGRFLYVGGVLVTSIYIASTTFRVEPDPIPAP